jgi:hypothetical protein
MIQSLPGARSFLNIPTMSGDYSEQPAEALAVFCGRYLAVPL